MIITASKTNECQFCTYSHCDLVDIADIVADPLIVIEDTERARRRANAWASSTPGRRCTTRTRSRSRSSQQLHEHFSDPELVELSFLIGYINMLNLFNNLLAGPLQRRVQRAEADGRLSRRCPSLSWSRVGATLAFGAGGCGDARSRLQPASWPRYLLRDARPGAGRRRSTPRGRSWHGRHGIRSRVGDARSRPVTRGEPVVRPRPSVAGGRSARRLHDHPTSVRTSRSPSTAGSRSSRRSWPGIPARHDRPVVADTATRPPTASEPACSAGISRRWARGDRHLGSPLASPSGGGQRRGVTGDRARPDHPDAEPADREGERDRERRQRAPGSR